MSITEEEVMQAFTNRRTSSVSALCTSFSVSIEELAGCIETLKEKGMVRTVLPACSGSCSSCESCSTEAVKKEAELTPETIIISLVLGEE